MPACGKGSSLTRPYRWFPIVVFVCVLLGCGSDLPPDTGVGTISGRIHYSGKYYSDGKIIGLERPHLMIFASFEPPYGVFQSTLMVSCKKFPAGGYYYELKGLYPSDYYVYGVIGDWSRDDWGTPFTLGGYKWVSEKVTVTSTAAAVDIDFTMIDVQ